jgi:hypothetical protein
VDRRFSFGDADAIRALLADAGFRNIDVETVTLRDRMADPDTFVAMNLGATVDLSTMEEAERREAVSAFQAAARKRTAPFLEGTSLVHPVSANVVTAAV